MKKIGFVLAATSLLALSFPHLCLTNAAEPPSILIIAPNPPADLEIRLGSLAAYQTHKLFESYFTFYRRDLTASVYTFTIFARGEFFTVTLDAPLKTYNNTYTLDLEHRALIPGKRLSREIGLPTLRIALTLLIEGLVFWLFGYRRRRSWLVFILANLATQLFLNLTLLRDVSPAASYLIIGLFLIEVLITIVELAVFLIFINEKPRWLTVLYVLLANLLSLFLGGFLITQLPV